MQSPTTSSFTFTVFLTTKNLFLLPLFLLLLLHVLFIKVSADQGDGFSESESFFSFIRAIDPQNMLHIDGSSSHPCMMKLKGTVRCDSEGINIVEIRLENLNLSGTIDAESLCRLKRLRVLSLAQNNIRGNVPNSILHCARLSFLNLSSNHLSGNRPIRGLMKLKFLRKLDISNNNLPVSRRHHQEFNHFFAHLFNEEEEGGVKTMAEPPVTTGSNDEEGDEFSIIYVLIIGIVLLFLVLYFASVQVRKKSAHNNNKTVKSMKQFHIRKAKTEVEEEEEEMKRLKKIRDTDDDELVFFEENERFTMKDLLEAPAELRSDSFCCCLYKVRLKNGSHYAVKRFKNLQVSPCDFSETLRKISMVKHPNILPLVGYRCSTEEKLVIYSYHNNGSLLNLFKDYLEGKKYFPWKLRLSIARGIARGLAFIHQKKAEQQEDIIPHGNLKLSNILLNNNNEPLISEHGLSKFLDTTRRLFFISGLAYTAPEKIISEKADVYSFGVMLLELLTGKSIELSRIDLTKWVRSMVNEEWTVEVFDKEVRENEYQWAFPVLNAALMCVSSVPETRPSTEEIVEMIEEVMKEKEEKEHDHDDDNVHQTTYCPIGSNQLHEDCCSLHKIIPDTWDSPASNY